MGRIIIILLIHVIADFFFQGSKMSKLKASKYIYLFEHVTIYTLFFVVLSPILLGLTVLEGLIFSLINGVLHLLIDFIIGKYKTKYYLTNESKYVEVIGLDHTLHLIILITTYIYIFPHAINSTYNLFNL